jgi:dedicated sortase system histidine kinase
VATVLHDRPELFTNNSVLNNQEDSQENDVYAYPLPNYINLNGDITDWGEQTTQANTYFPADASNGDNVFSVKHLLGYHGRFIYAQFQVEDETVLLRQPEFLRLDAADHIRLTLQDPGRPEQRYVLSAREPGRMSIYQIDENWQYPITGRPNYDLAAELKLTDDGYNVELQIPRFILTSDTRIHLAVADIDNEQTLALEALVSTTPESDKDDLSRLLVQSPQIAKILKGLDRADTRIWVIDRDKKVRTVVGNIQTKMNEDAHEKPKFAGKKFDYAIQVVRYYYNKTLQSIFALIIDSSDTPVFYDEDTLEQRNDQVIEQALGGAMAIDKRSSLDGKATILMSAHPVFLGDNVLGTVVVEQSTNQILHQQKDVLENVMSVTLLVLITVATALLLFASRLTLRIRRLRDATDSAIDTDGRIVNQKISADHKAGDEIGDLSRSVSNMLGRLSQYTNYLRGLPDTLAHELSNPLNVVNSSLHNLSQESPSIAESKYIERAKNGINRIGSILRNLTEAANLEQAMQSETREKVDLIVLIESYMEGYALSNPEQAFELTKLSEVLWVDAAPDYIAQALDKLVDNAIDFAATDTAIVFKAKRIEGFAQIDVINQGSLLPDGMSERIFEPLVSLGRKDAQKTRLGMGLYIVKLITNFHRGDIIARNLSNGRGVIFSLSLPIHSDHRLTY